jgi:hypothetical protein
VADIDDRQPRLVAQALQIAQDLGLARRIERGRRASSPAIPSSSTTSSNRPASARAEVKTLDPL